MKVFPKFRGENSKKIFELPPPSNFSHSSQPNDFQRIYLYNAKMLIILNFFHLTWIFSLLWPWQNVCFWSVFPLSFSVPESFFTVGVLNGKESSSRTFTRSVESKAAPLAQPVSLGKFNETRRNKTNVQIWGGVPLQVSGFNQPIWKNMTVVKLDPFPKLVG